MNKATALGIALATVLGTGSAHAFDCNTVISLLNQGYSMGQVAEAGGIPLATVDGCWRHRQTGFAMNPAGPPPLNAAGPPPVNAAGRGPANPAGAPPLNPAGPPPRNPAGPGPVNPAGIPR